MVGAFVVVLIVVDFVVIDVVLIIIRPEVYILDIPMLTPHICKINFFAKLAKTPLYIALTFEQKNNF